jgi:hypothetical protein
VLKDDRFQTVSTAPLQALIAAVMCVGPASLLAGQSHLTIETPAQRLSNTRQPCKYDSDKAGRCAWMASLDDWEGEQLQRVEA